MGLWHGFGLSLDDRLKRLFGKAPKVIVKAWAPAEIYVPDYFTFEGRLDGGSEVVLEYGECGPREFCEYMNGHEKGKIAIGGLALEVVRNFLNVAEGTTRLYVGVRMDIDREKLLGQELIPVEELIRVRELELCFSSSTKNRQAELEIRGLNEHSVLTTRYFPSPDSWRIYASEEVRYAGLSNEESAEKPEWLEKALDEWRAC